ncbi:MAG: MFS transporter, partial [Candidatus Eremiobacteraeota bacterium]|nr:MFS transporter [Candidatus Eremiobacteraeota bacterium]
LRVLRYRAVAAGSILGGVLGVSLYGSIVILPQYVQNSLGFSATTSGQLILVRALAISFVTPAVAMIVTKSLIDARILIGCGFVLIGISNWLLGVVTTTDSSFWTFGLSLIVGGIGLGMIFVPLSISVLSAVPARDVPKAAAFYNLSRQIGGSIATAILVTLLTRGIAAHQTALAGHVALHTPSIQTFLHAHGGEHAANALQQLYALVGAQALVLSYADTARVTALISIVLAPLVFLLRRPTLHGGPIPVE